MNEVEKLRDWIEQLEQILGIDRSENGRIRQAFSLEPDQARIFGMLLKRNFVPHDALYTVMYEHLPECEWPDTQVLDVQICKLRRKLKKHDIKITKHWGEGWSIPKDDKTKAKSVLGPEADTEGPRRVALDTFRDIWR